MKESITKSSFFCHVGKSILSFKSFSEITNANKFSYLLNMMNENMFQGIFDFSRGINLVYGEAATGKTTIAMQLSRDVAKDKRVIFIDSENGFSLERFKQICGEGYKERLGRIFLLNAKSFFEQHKIIDGLSNANAKNIGLVVVDTLGMHYRTYVREDYASANRMMDKQFKVLQELTRNGIPVLITTQVYGDAGGDDVKEKSVKLLGGEMIRNWCGMVIKLEKLPREIVIEKPFRKEYKFQIWNSGVQLV